MPEIQEQSRPSRPKPRLTRVTLRRQIEIWLSISRHTLREPLLRIAGHLALLTLIALGVWATRLGLDTLPVDAAAQQESYARTPEVTSMVSSNLELKDLPPYVTGGVMGEGITRLADVHTIFPDRPRMDMIKYVVQTGDTLFGIAEKFGLQPESVLWGNFDVLEDDPHRLSPGQELRIPPVDGTVYMWSEGDGLGGVGRFFGVSAQDIIEWPGNYLDPSMDIDNPDIVAGTVLMVPGGRREIVTWSAPRIYRSNPAAAKIFGAGYCGQVVDGPIGIGIFSWPTAVQFLSGYGFSSIHPAIDIAGRTGHAIFASDSGVVVYSGWNDYGYGYVVVVDHGNSWQTLYAHLSQIEVSCGQAVFQGQVIAAMGSSGNSSGSHLHFELMHDEYGKVNPWNFLP